MSTDPRWTDETEDLLARELYAYAGGIDEDDRFVGFDEDEREVRDSCMEGSRRFLGSLADAGLLVPVDVDRDEQRGVLNPQTGQVSRCPERVCEHTEDEQQRERVRTFVSFTTPWTEAQS